MFKELNEIIDFIENSKFAKELDEILQKINKLKEYVTNNDYDNAIIYALHINRTTNYEGLFGVRNDLHLVKANPDNNPTKITPEQHIFGTLDALTKLALKKIADNISEDIAEKSITINWNDKNKFIFKIIKKLTDKE